MDTERHDIDPTWSWLTGQSHRVGLESATPGGDPTSLPWVEEFFSLPSPRAVPPQLLKSSSPFRGCTTCFMVIFLTIALGLVFLVLPASLPVELAMDLGWVAYGDARIERYEATSATERFGGQKKWGSTNRSRTEGGTVYRIYRVDFRLNADGREIRLANYFRGSSAIPGIKEGRYNASGGALEPIAVRAEYFPFFPEMARLPGGRISRIPRFAILAVLPPCACLIAFLGIHRRRRLRMALLARGVLGDATVVRHRQGMTGKHGTQYKSRLHFSHPEGMTEKTFTATNEVARMLGACHDEGRTVRIVSLPGKPKSFQPVLSACCLLNRGVGAGMIGKAAFLLREQSEREGNAGRR